MTQLLNLIRLVLLISVGILPLMADSSGSPPEGDTDYWDNLDTDDPDGGGESDVDVDTDSDTDTDTDTDTDSPDAGVDAGSTKCNQPKTR